MLMALIFIWIANTRFYPSDNYLFSQSDNVQAWCYRDKHHLFIVISNEYRLLRFNVNNNSNMLNFNDIVYSPYSLTLQIKLFSNFLSWHLRKEKRNDILFFFSCWSYWTVKLSSTNSIRWTIIIDFTKLRICKERF